jgi:hypothetical protein
MTDPTHPDPAWTPDQLAVWNERLAIMAQDRTQPGNTFAEYHQARKEANEEKQREVKA